MPSCIIQNGRSLWTSGVYIIYCIVAWVGPTPAIWIVFTCSSFLLSVTKKHTVILKMLSRRRKNNVPYWPKIVNVIKVLCDHLFLMLFDSKRMRWEWTDSLFLWNIGFWSQWYWYCIWNWFVSQQACYLLTVFCHRTQMNLLKQLKFTLKMKFYTENCKELLK